MAQPLHVARSVLGRAWRLREHDEATALALCQRLGLAEIIGRVLAGRGIGLDAVAAFLSPRVRACLPDPSHLLDLDRAADRIASAIAGGERIGLIGDYDVDGATATALVARYCRTLGAEPLIEIPDRLSDGYGPNRGALERLAAAGCKLVLTLDSGTTAIGALAFAKDLGLDVIVVDHHTPDRELPPAYAVINPNRHDQVSPLAHVAAVGLAFVLLVAVTRALRSCAGLRDRAAPELLGLLDLVAMGTVCDVVPLTGINRAFVHQGLKVLRNGGNPGLAALARAAGVPVIENAHQLGFVLGPRINAAGRLGHAALAPRLLLADDPAEAEGLAARLHQMNAERQAVERGVLLAAEQSLAAEAADDPVLVLAGEGWHVGVVGIVAARLVERFARPAFVLSIEAGVAKGSARSIPGFDVGAAVMAAREAGLADKAGGHALAAGLTVGAEKLPRLREFLKHRAASELGDGPRELDPLDVDGMLTTAAIVPNLARELEKLSPFGAGNVEPRFCVTDARPIAVKQLGNGHLACALNGLSTGSVRAIAFRAGGTALEQALSRGAPLRLAGRVQARTWQGSVSASFVIEDAADPCD